MKITGKTLIAMGYKPGKWFKGALVYANEKKLQGAALKKYLDAIAPKVLDLHKFPVAYHKNIQAETHEELTNVEAVFATMDVLMKTPTVLKGAVMPDACPTGAKGQIPVGGVVVAKNAIHPAMHSADICCSVMATSLGKVAPKTALDIAQKVTHFGGGGRKELFDLPKSFEKQLKGNYFLKDENSLNLAKTHLGTQGDGNHFLFIGKSEKTGETMMVTHHGSRGLGASLFKKGMKVADAFRKEISPKTLKANAWIPFNEDVGKNYWEALQLVRAWTKMNHEVIHQETCRQLGVDTGLQFWNEHNFVFKEGDLFYHAKGATPLDDKFVPDSYEQLRLIPLNMSEPVLIVKGERTKSNLGFAPHGAGRNVSRSQHLRNKADLSKEQVFAEETKGLDVRFYSGHMDLSELPSAYKNAQSVQAQMQHFGLGQVVDKILPYGCIMAGDWKIDAPWRKRKR